MIALYVFLCIFATLIIYRKGGLFSPSFTQASFTTLSLSVFYLFYLTETDPEGMIAARWLIAKYSNSVMKEVFKAHFLMVLLCLLSVWKLKKPETLSMEKLAQKLIVIGAVAKRLAGSLPVHYFVATLFFLTMIHMYMIDKGLLWENSAYLMITEPESMGTHFPIIKILHMLIGPVCVMTMVMALLLSRCGQYRNALLSLIMFGYYFLIELAAFSRFAAMSLAVLCAILVAERKVRRAAIISPPVIMSACGTIFLLIYALHGRHGDVQGIAGILPTLFSDEYSFDDFNAVLSNLVLGTYVLAETLQTGPYTYNLNYQILAFSPFPSIIDGFAKNAKSSQYMLTWYAPFNSLGEIENFDLPFQILAVCLFTLCLRTLNKAVAYFGELVGLLMVAPGVYAMYCIHQYPIRNSFRILLGTAITAYVAMWISKEKTEAGMRILASKDAALRPVKVARWD